MKTQLNWCDCTKQIHKGFKRRDESIEERAKWKQACTEYQARYNLLAFPGGYDGALERIAEGDQQTIEAAICFLELRPYFFRSGYMFKDIFRRCKRAPLSEAQAKRFAVVAKKARKLEGHENHAQMISREAIASDRILDALVRRQRHPQHQRLKRREVQPVVRLIPIQYPQKLERPILIRPLLDLQELPVLARLHRPEVHAARVSRHQELVVPKLRHQRPPRRLLIGTRAVRCLLYTSRCV